MKMRKYICNSVDYQNHIDKAHLDCALKGAIHVDTHIGTEERFGRNPTITIFAFFPDNMHPSDKWWGSNSVYNDSHDKEYYDYLYPSINWKAIKKLFTRK